MSDPHVSHPKVDPAEALPLTGLRVLELHAIGPVPFVGMALRQMGAEVTRVSPPRDPGLGLMTPPAYDLLNQGKATLALDLKQSAGQEAMTIRLAITDVLLEGFRPGVLERLNLAPPDLLSRYPRLVIGRLSGWGDSGPLAARAGHDINYLALTGVLSTLGKVDQPMPPMNLIADFGGGAMHLLAGVLARLARRGIDGKGGVVTTSIAAGTVGLTPMVYGLLAAGDWQLKREANLLDGGAPFYRTYRCADDRFVAVGALEPKFYLELLAVTGLQGQLDPARQYERATWPVAESAFSRRFAERTRDDWAEAGADRDCCLTPVLDLLEAAVHPHLVANGWFVDRAGETAGGNEADADADAGGAFAAPRPVVRFHGGASRRTGTC